MTIVRLVDHRQFRANFFGKVSAHTAPSFAAWMVQHDQQTGKRGD
jgi:hypothetical protein